jgi:hypothetical protein
MSVEQACKLLCKSAVPLTRQPDEMLRFVAEVNRLLEADASARGALYGAQCEVVLCTALSVLSSDAASLCLGFKALCALAEAVRQAGQGKPHPLLDVQPAWRICRAWEAQRTDLQATARALELLRVLCGADRRFVPLFEQAGACALISDTLTT